MYPCRVRVERRPERRGGRLSQGLSHLLHAAKVEAADVETVVVKVEKLKAASQPDTPRVVQLTVLP
jgi:hypothetical protein